MSSKGLNQTNVHVYKKKCLKYVECYGSHLIRKFCSICPALFHGPDTAQSLFENPGMTVTTKCYCSCSFNLSVLTNWQVQVQPVNKTYERSEDILCQLYSYCTHPLAKLVWILDRRLLASPGDSYSSKLI